MGIPKIDRGGILWFYAQEDKNQVSDRPIFLYQRKKPPHFFFLPDDFLSCVLWGGETGLGGTTLPLMQIGSTITPHPHFCHILFLVLELKCHWGKISLNISCSPPSSGGKNILQKIERGYIKKGTCIGNNQGSIVRRWSRCQDKKDQDEWWRQLRRRKRERAQCAGSGSGQSKALGGQVSDFQNRFLLLFGARFAIGILVLFSSNLYCLGQLVGHYRSKANSLSRHAWIGICVGSFDYYNRRDTDHYCLG